MVSRKTSGGLWGVALLVLNLTLNSEGIPGLNMTYDGFAVNLSRAGILLQLHFVCRYVFDELLFLLFCHVIPSSRCLDRAVFRDFVLFLFFCTYLRCYVWGKWTQSSFAIMNFKELSGYWLKRYLFNPTYSASVSHHVKEFDPATSQCLGKFRKRHFETLSYFCFIFLFIYLLIIIIIIISYFSIKISIGLSCKLYHLETICMKGRRLFSEKHEQYYQVVVFWNCT